MNKDLAKFIPPNLIQSIEDNLKVLPAAKQATSDVGFLDLKLFNVLRSMSKYKNKETFVPMSKIANERFYYNVTQTNGGF